MDTQTRLTVEELASLDQEAKRLDAHSVCLTAGDNVIAEFLGKDDENVGTATVMPWGEIIFYIPAK
jgi:hypothetical protein